MTTSPKSDVPAAETQGHRTASDKGYWERMSGIIEEHEHSFQHVLSLFPTYIRRQQLTRFLALYELFKQVIDLPGEIVEVGVYRGYSFFTFHKLMETFNATDRRRKVFGFEHFAGLRNFHPKDGPMDPRDGKVEGGFETKNVRREVLDLIKLTNDDNLIPGVERSHLIEGDVCETIPKFVEENPGLRIALLHLDADLYLPTKATLEHLYPRVVRGGIVAFDEYGLIPWEGETIAADEYFASIGEKPAFKKFPWSGQPHGYFVKE
jgi:hypothetical protein